MTNSIQATRFSETRLQEYRTKWVKPALAKMHSSKKDVDVQFGEMDIGKTLAHLEWFLMGEGETYNPHTLEYDVDAMKYKHMKQIGENEKQEVTDELPVHQMGLQKWLAKSLHNTMQENAYNPITAMEVMAEQQQEKLNTGVYNDTLSDEQIVHQQNRVNNNLGSVDKIKFIQQWMESFYLAYFGQQFIPSNVAKAKVEGDRAKAKETAQARIKEVMAKLGK